MGESGADELRREADRLRRTADHLLWSFVLVLEHSRPATFVGGPIAEQVSTLLTDAEHHLRAAVADLRRTADGCEHRAATVEALDLGR